MKQFGLKPEQIDALSRCFAKYPAVEQVILYGSRAKGNFKEEFIKMKNYDRNQVLIPEGNVLA